MKKKNKRYGTLRVNNSNNNNNNNNKKYPEDFLKKMRDTGTGFSKEELRHIKEEK